ncbi:hypothetical protein ElyMa_006558900 [Elysia marginata]|uniref:Uncharacterized protein n=1 Tax=Elysia marginata TaxID=1093978 RepID=A0AAV4IAN2_9GAST|nr:hypothetical protein ElyMa_006558900 [Elysia marginata]
MLTLGDRIHDYGYNLRKNAQKLLGSGFSYRESAASVAPGPSKDKWETAADLVTLFGDIVFYHAKRVEDKTQIVEDFYGSGLDKLPQNFMDAIEQAVEVVKAALDGLDKLDVFSRVTQALNELRDDASTQDVTADIDHTLEAVKQAKDELEKIRKDYDPFKNAAGFD